MIGGQDVLKCRCSRAKGEQRPQRDHVLQHDGSTISAEHRRQDEIARRARAMADLPTTFGDRSSRRALLGSPRNGRRGGCDAEPRPMGDDGAARDEVGGLLLARRQLPERNFLTDRRSAAPRHDRLGATALSMHLSDGGEVGRRSVNCPPAPTAWTIDGYALKTAPISTSPSWACMRPPSHRPTRDLCLQLLRKIDPAVESIRLADRRPSCRPARPSTTGRGSISAIGAARGKMHEFRRKGAPSPASRSCGPGGRGHSRLPNPPATIPVDTVLGSHEVRDRPDPLRIKESAGRSRSAITGEDAQVTMEIRAAGGRCGARGRARVRRLAGVWDCRTHTGGRRSGRTVPP